MKGVNKAIIVGSLGADPESKTMPNGYMVCNISIATSEQWLDKNGQKNEKPSGTERSALDVPPRSWPSI